ncbi:MAG TPA: hypothetical protein VFS15_08545 [Kofleriaceae bacterium]|nr:hypothetical protein [Kofleriaceae bacterium]
MSPKNVVLIAAAVAVVAMGLYLFIQVKASPAQAHVTATSAPATTHPSPPPTPHERAPEPNPAPSHTAAARPTPWVGDSRPSRTAPPALETEPAEEDKRPNLKLENMMELANKAYDRQDFDEAIAIAGKVLAKEPTNVRMLRVMVSANCIAGDSAVAQEAYEKLPPFDREQMRTRCDRYGVTFKEPAQ